MSTVVSGGRIVEIGDGMWWWWRWGRVVGGGGGGVRLFNFSGPPLRAPDRRWNCHISAVGHLTVGPLLKASFLRSLGICFTYSSHLNHLSYLVSSDLDLKLKAPDLVRGLHDTDQESGEMSTRMKCCRAGGKIREI
ncbi:unnamed protein product [Lactuca virosa]|uniref:Uncharacterized protein n=1 Tax=Lactuca virosa TaxID=75947 RepID=A0AAU9PJM5_9ASTR|nr:unnamed protein product [Lactuca virosa]